MVIKFMKEKRVVKEYDIPTRLSMQNDPNHQKFLMEMKGNGCKALCTCQKGGVPMLVVYTADGTLTFRDQKSGLHDNSCPISSAYHEKYVAHETRPKFNKMMFESIPGTICENEIKTKKQPAGAKHEFQPYSKLELILRGILDVNLFQYGLKNISDVHILQKNIVNDILTHDMHSELTVITLNKYKNVLRRKGGDLYVASPQIVSTLPWNIEQSPAPYEFDFYNAYRKLSKTAQKRLQNSLKVFGGKADIKGPYIVTWIRFKAHKQKNNEVKGMVIVPIVEYKKKIVSVDSSIERDVICRIIEKGVARVYKPMHCHGYIDTLEKFLPWDCYKEFKDAQKNFRKGSWNGSWVRPDLFFELNGQYYVIEIAGMMDIPEYVDQIRKKEEGFYSKLKRMKYLRIESIADLASLEGQHEA